MPWDELDRLIRAAVVREVERGLPALEGLEGRVIQRLARPVGRPALARRLCAALAWPRIRLGWALATGVALLAVGIFVGRVLLPSRGTLPAAGANLFTVAAPGATSVAVVGDFSAWQPIGLFDHDGDGVWTVTVALPPGRYEYAYLVDGRWVGQDPLASEYVRTFGEYVSVRYIGGEGL
ncbi:MAG: hypothetical protein Kow0097_09770 [Candidatus Bipolaricaulota bacterium]|nr:hypothetical protein [Candidatus Bipolaricaulota bacterium]